LQATTAQYFFFGLFTATTYLLAGWAREQVCTYMCPWPRFQSAMIDEETFAVTYRDWRGEPRGKHKKGDSWSGHGDCVDCRACVAACPTGIDIRDGFQLECIGCGLCIDACNEIMDRVERPRGLIAFDTHVNSEAVRRGAAPDRRYIRPRTVFYALLLALISGIMLVTLLHREDFTVALLPDRAPLFVRLSDGSIRDGFTLKIDNRKESARSFLVGIADLPNASLRVAELGDTAAGPAGIAIPVEADAVGSYHVLVQAPRQEVEEVPFRFLVRPADSEKVTEHAATFRGPAK